MGLALESGGSPGDLCKLAQDCGIWGNYCLDSHLFFQEDWAHWGVVEVEQWGNSMLYYKKFNHLFTLFIGGDTAFLFIFYGKYLISILPF